MPRKEPEHSGKGLAIFVFAAILLAAGTGIYLWPEKEEKKPVTPQPSIEQPQPKRPSPHSEPKAVGKPIVRPPEKLMDLDRLDRDENLQAKIRDRKEEHGIGDSVDAIVQEDETIKVGDSKVPMKEILEKIRIRRGEIAEDTLADQTPELTPRQRKEKIDREFEKARTRVQELEKILGGPSASPEKVPDYQRYAKELKDLKELARIYEQYENVTREIETAKQDAADMGKPESTAKAAAHSEKPDRDGKTKEESRQLDSAPFSKKIGELELLRDNLALQLERALGIKKKPGMFGVYVVKKNDNIWNIHFAFLKDYFESKGIAISPAADEPENGGKSSGVGKILKFAERIVYIYNVREKKLDVNLDLISPKSKIVVFRMEDIFAFLDELDLETVDRIRFDGENIWIPAQS